MKPLSIIATVTSELFLQLLGVIGAVVLAGVLASRKGFNIWLWILPAAFVGFTPGRFPTLGIPLGFIILVCMPSACAKNITEELRMRRRRSGNTVGGVLTVLAAALLAGLWWLVQEIARWPGIL